MRKFTFKSQAGFTIIEVVIATTVFFIGVLGVFSVFPTSLKMADLSKISTHMTLVGQSKMDELIAIGYSNLTPGTYTNPDLSHIITDATLRSHFDTSEITISVAEGHHNNEARNPINNQPLLYEIDFEVNYELSPGKFKTENFITLLSNPTYG